MVLNKNVSVFTVCGISVLFLVVVLVYIKKKPYTPTPIISHLKKKLKLVNPYFSKLDIRESTKSYTENKSIIYICTRDPITKQYYSENTLMYVCLHECAHVMMADYDENHSDKFKKVFEKILDKAITVGVYDPSIPIPKTYCGMNN